MPHVVSTLRRPGWLRCFVTLVVVPALAVSLTAQAPPKKPPKKEEEEETTKPRPKVPIKVEDEPPAKPPAAAAADLAEEAKQAKHPAVRDLYRALAEPIDTITLKKGAIFVEPIPTYLGAKVEFTGLLRVQPADAPGKPEKSLLFSSKVIESVEHYEQRALKKVEQFLKSKLDREPADSPKHLSRAEMQAAAEKVLTAVLRFHDSARERGLRVGAGWDDVKKSLQSRLLKLQMDELNTLADARDWLGALELAERLRDMYPKEPAVHAAVARVQVLQIEEALKGGKDTDFILVRHNLDRMDKEVLSLGGNEAEPVRRRVEAIRQRLRNRATDLWKEADRLSAKDKPRALALMQTAEAIDPQLPGLRDSFDRLSDAYPVLFVGVRNLPEHLSPALASTDVERQAGELLFEGLVRPVFDPKVGQRFEASLAAGAPRLVPHGRQFQLARGACWSDGEPVLAADVHETVRMLKDRDWVGRSPEWADLIGEARVEDPFRLHLGLHRGYLDPLALMTFKVLPSRRLKQIDDYRFDEKPIGSGPYLYAGRKTESNPTREYAVFQANPYYASRDGRSGQPRIREVRFFRSVDPRAEFQTGRLQLLLDLPTNQIQPLLSPEANLQNITIKTLKNRRVWFLAVNHRRGPLQSVELRRALSLAIDREKILTDYFRSPDVKEPVHRWLNGPYPRGSWPCHPDMDKDDPASPYYPYQPSKAKALYQQARLAGTKLSLRFPNDDARVQQACEYLRTTLESSLGLELELKPRSPRQLRQEVELEHDYDLAYYCWDYPDETYWLWPLFDPRAMGRGGRNFLGYGNDDQLQALFRRALDHRHFAEVRRLCHEIHAHLFEKMPLIPLWQLDMHIALRNDLKTVPPPEKIDPLLVFTEIEQWRLQR